MATPARKKLQESQDNCTNDPETNKHFSDNNKSIKLHSVTASNQTLITYGLRSG